MWMNERILLVLCFIPLCSILVTSEHDHSVENVEGINVSLKFVFIFSAIFIGALVRHVIKISDIPIPTAVFLVTLGILLGIGTMLDATPEFSYLFKVSHAIIINIIDIYLPALIFSTAFYIDNRAFLKSLGQIIIIGFPMSFFTACLVGSLMTLVLASETTEWAIVDGILLGVMLMPLYPLGILRWLKNCNQYQMKHVTILLEGEILISAASSSIIFLFITGYNSGWVITGYKFLVNIVWSFCVGIPLCFLFGNFGALLMRLAFNDSFGLMLLTVTICYTNYYVFKWFFNAGVVGTVTVGLIMGLQRASLSKDMEQAIVEFWRMTLYSIECILYLTIGVVTPKYLEPENNGQDEIHFGSFILVFVTYLLFNIFRAVTFVLFAPILSRMGYGLTFRNMIICVWAGLRNPICLAMVLGIQDTTYQEAKSDLFHLHVLSVYILFLFINGSCIPILMKALSLSEESISRQVNMNNCMKAIYEARARTVAILKMDRFLSDANWPLVMNATELRHPYKKHMTKKEDNDDDEYFSGYRFTYCPDCKRNITNEPTEKEFEQMKKEAKLRLLKIKKSAYSRQYENGMLSKDAIKILHQAIEIAADSEEMVVKLDGLFKLFSKQGIFFQYLTMCIQYCLRSTGEEHKLPRKRSRIICYWIINSIYFAIFINLVVILNVIIVAYHHIQLKKKSKVNIYLFSYIFSCIYMCEFCLKIIGLSWIYICRHGFYFYFKSTWNVLEFISLICITLGVVVYTISNSRLFHLTIDIVILIFLTIRIVRISLSYMNLFSCCENSTEAVIKYLNAQIDRHRILAFELGKSYIAAEEEVLENLHKIIDNDKIREDVRKTIIADRLALVRMLGVAQKESPRVATTVKTILSMRTVLHAMKSDVEKLKVAGWVDDIENYKLLKSLQKMSRSINSVKIIEPLSAKFIFREVNYMADDDEVVDFLYANVSTKKFEPGDYIVREGEIIEGIYIVITGILYVEYIPKLEYIEKLKENGILPITDYIVTLTYEEALQDYAIPGNSIGDLCILTGRPYSCSIRAETYSQVYVITKDLLKTATARENNPVTGIECRIWKCCTYRKALAILLNAPYYRSRDAENIAFTLERAFMPNLSNYKVFIVNEMMEDILLIEGVVVDFNSRDLYTAPCYIPRSVQKLVMPKSSFVSMDSPVETKLLVIPAKEYTEFEIMVTEEDTCELVSDESNLCLRHLINQKAQLASKVSKASREKTGIFSRVKQRVGGRVDLPKNKAISINSMASTSAMSNKSTTPL